MNRYLLGILCLCLLLGSCVHKKTKKNSEPVAVKTAPCTVEEFDDLVFELEIEFNSLMTQKKADEWPGFEKKCDSLLETYDFYRRHEGYAQTQYMFVTSLFYQAKFPALAKTAAEICKEFPGNSEYIGAIYFYRGVAAMEQGNQNDVALGFLQQAIDLSSDYKIIEAAKQASARITVAVGNRAPDVYLHDFDGNEFELRAEKGTVILLDVWGPWSSRCVADIPGRIRLRETYPDEKTFKIVGVAFGTERSTINKFRTFMAAHDITWRQCLLTDPLSRKDLKIQLGMQKVPFNLLVKKDGTIAGVNLMGEDLRKALRIAMQE